MVVQISLGRVLDSLLEPAVGRRPVPVPHRGEDERGVDAGDLVVAPVFSSEREALSRLCSRARPSPRPCRST